MTSSKCEACGRADDRGSLGLTRDDDNKLRCNICARKRRLELCPIQPTDLRGITRRSDQCLTVVTIHMDWQTSVEWLRFGEAQLQHRDHNDTDQLMAYMSRNVTDFEHDSAYALSLPLIGLRFKRLDYHTTHFTAWVNPNADPNDFRVPRSGYDPTKHEDAMTCGREQCESPHVIVPEGYYQPPHKPRLYKLVRGKRVEIAVSQPSSEVTT